MAKGAASAAQMGALHKTMTSILMKVLKTYEARLDALEKIDMEEMEQEMLAKLFAKNIEPSPAMMGVVAKFLKDNSIEFEAEEVNELGAIQKRLQAKKANRPKFASVTELEVQGTA